MSYELKKPKNETKTKISKAARKAGMEAMSKAMTTRTNTVRKIHKTKKI